MFLHAFVHLIIKCAPYRFFLMIPTHQTPPTPFFPSLPFFFVFFQLSLGWVYLFMGILVGSAVVPITLCMCWGRLTGVAMVAGSVGGTLLALITWLSVASTYKGGLSKFLDNTGELTFCPGRDRANQTQGKSFCLFKHNTHTHTNTHGAYRLMKGEGQCCLAEIL